MSAYAFANSVRTQSHRLTVCLDNQGAEMYRELFDYENDPLETTNFAGHPAQAGVQRELSNLLAAGWKACRPAVS